MKYIYIYLLDRLRGINSHKLSLSNKYHIFKKLHRHLSFRVIMRWKQLQRKVVFWVNNTHFIASCENHFSFLYCGYGKWKKN